MQDTTPPVVTESDAIVACLGPPNHGYVRADRELLALGDRLFGLSPSAVGIADLEQQLRVARVRTQESVVLLQRLGLRALLRMLSRRIQDFSFIQRQ